MVCRVVTPAFLYIVTDVLEERYMNPEDHIRHLHRRSSLSDRRRSLQACSQRIGRMSAWLLDALLTFSLFTSVLFNYAGLVS
jgi:hypothetical protein